MGSKEFDEILENIGGMGRYQIVMYFLLGLVGFPIGMHYMVSVFIAAVPQHHCVTPSLHNNFSRTDILNAFIPYENIDGEIQRSKCKIANWPLLLTATEGNNSIKQLIKYTRESIERNGTYATVGKNSINGLTAEYTPSNESGIGQIYCDSWEYDTSEYTSTIVSEFDLVCGMSWRRALASSIFMSGCMVGAVIFGGLSDRFGRKPVLLVAIVLTVICGTGAAFAPEYWSFVLLRAVVASGAAGSSIVAFVLILEMMPPKGRMIPGIFYHAFFCGGYTLLSLIAFGVRNHVHVQLIVSLPPLALLIYFWLADESPRWLLAEGRVDEANTILTKVARMNKAEYSDKLLIDSQINNETGADSVNGTILDLFRTPNLRLTTLNVCFNWFVNSMVYYGLSFGVEALPGSIYINLFFSGLVEFPGYFFAILTMNRIGRRKSLAISLVVGGLACLACFPVPKRLALLKTILSLVGKCAISSSFAIIYVFSVELFPTVVRNSGVGAGSMCARIGGVVAPFIGQAASAWAPLPYIVFGSFSIVAGLLSLLLPETLGRALPQTLEDGENFKRKLRKNKSVLLL
ncbi:unnamed protein product [Owenia fusiformis]|uniref:Uncharacterized protein n=1 Tax=Owenia fusiformis TaxID=6347 RepID=A0A8J1XRR1_OWEFU|nr:unnamed protein product [Owenia fusiformis]